MYDYGRDGGSDDDDGGGNYKKYPECFHTACIVYGAHVSTTLIPILVTFWFSLEMTSFQKFIMIGV